jgi:beta-galactosidase
MKYKYVFFIIFMLGIIQIQNVSGQSVTRIADKFDYDWKFYIGDFEGASKSGFDDRSWRLLDLLHDWSIEGTVNRDAPTGGSGGMKDVSVEIIVAR